VTKRPTRDELEQRVKELEEKLANLRHNEEALREGQARYRAILEDQAELICRFTADGTLAYVNDAYCGYLAKKPEELIGQKLKPLIPRENHGKLKEHFSLFSPENDVLSHEHRVIAPTGAVRWQRWTNKAIYDVHGNLVEFQSVGHDVSDRKHAEEALQKAHDTLEKRVEERTVELAEANERLEKVDTGLQVLIEHRQEEMRRLQDNIMENVHKLITPYIEKMDLKTGPIWRS
jgi:PAS domain S-box-containing protein